MARKIMTAALALALLGAAAPAYADEYKDALDRYMITEVMYRYAILHNMSDIKGYADLFTDDAVIYDQTMHYEFAKGRAGIMAQAESDRKKYNPQAKGDGTDQHLGILRHVISDPVVTLHGDGTASGICYVQILGNKPGFGPVLLNLGYYKDQYVKRGGRWLIARRDIYAMEMANWGLAKELNLANGPVPGEKK